MRRQNRDVAGVTLRIEDVCHDIAIVLVVCATARHEHRLKGRMARAEIVHLCASTAYVVLVEKPGADFVSPPVRCVGIAIVLSAETIVKT